MFELIKKHYLAILLAVVIGLVTLFPQFIAVSQLGASWQGVWPVVNDDEVYYLARGQEIVDGHYFLTNPYLAEHKSGDPMQFWLPDFLVAFPWKLLNIPVAVGYKFYDFIFPFILALLSYAIIYSLTGNKKLSLLGTSGLHLGLFLSLYNRTPSPQFIFIFWQLLALSIILFEKTQRSAFLGLATLSLAVLFYLYPYYWTYFLIFLAIYFVFRIFSDRQFKWKKYLEFLFSAGVLAGPYFIMQLKSWQSPHYHESLVRLGMLNTHFPSGQKIVFFGSLVLVFFAWSVYRKKISLNNLSLLVLAGTLAALVAVNQHLVTGKNLEFSSHYYNLSIVWYVYAASFLVAAWLPVKNLQLKWLSRTTALGLVGLIIFSALATINTQAKLSDYEIAWQRYGPVLVWLKENTEPDSVIFADRQLSSLIPAYTSNNVFYAREANLFFISDAEVAERFIINHYWDEFSDEFLQKNERAIWGTQFINAYNHNQSKNKLRKIFGLEPVEYVRLPQAELEFMKQAAALRQAKDFLENLAGYRVDYLVWDKTEDPDWQIPDDLKNNLLADFGDIIIYKINQ